MAEQTRIVSPGPNADSVRTSDGTILHAPADWQLLPPGDPGLTRRVKAAGPTWTVEEKRGRKLFSRGVWAAKAIIEQVRSQLETERSQPVYAKKQATAARRREVEQSHYVHTFQQTVLRYLAFASQYHDIAERVAEAVTAHATPVGSGTVARTARIPVEERAEAAVIAWLRHQTTAYDHMVIARVKGKRREVRRQLAQQSKRLLEKYRSGAPINTANCPLQQALTRSTAEEDQQGVA